jgi:acetyl-CoA synthetase
MFIEYWRQPEATAAKFAGDWCLTGDIGVKDERGYFWYKGREDDLIGSGGYRIGPTDIEDCILAHPAVLLVANELANMLNNSDDEDEARRHTVPQY